MDPIIGAALIGGGSLLGASLLGKSKPAKTEQLPTRTPQQIQGLNNLSTGLYGPQQQGLNLLSQNLEAGPEATRAFSDPYLRQFREQTVPGIAERFAGIGGQGAGGTGAGAMRSSAFTQALSQAGASLSERLANLRVQMQQSSLSQLSQFMNTAYGTSQFENTYRPRVPGFGESLAPGIGQGLGGALGMYGMNSFFNSPSPTPTAGFTPQEPI